MLGFLVFTFTFGAVSFRYVPVAPVSYMAVLSWFGGWYYILYNCYNLSSLLPVNVFTPTSCKCGFQYLLYWFPSIWFALVSLSWCPDFSFQNFSLEYPFCTLKPQLHQYQFTSKGNIFRILFFSSYPLLLVTCISLVTLVSGCMVLIATPNCYVKSVTASIKSAFEIVNFMTIPWSAMVFMAR